ncbi:phosphoenolpyruvate hydrolase family protein [Cognatishimia sp.]|uniref:phosphoenolpyruvate hydrolase family protein n=1 Tax=Cognatishimia sp. TaxID=2211648 RepID=UPI003514EE2B|nr:phosphoenolpyruvate hydrolase family protein [Cognatishimia sp.]
MARTKSDNLIIGAAVGSGISALAAEEGGADFLLAINAARFRNMGSPSIACMLPTHDANDLSIEFAVNEILPRAKLPVLIGLTCWHGDEEPAQLAERVKQLGFAGVVNFPSAMHFSQDMRQILDGVGMGTRKEAAVLKAAQDLGLQALCYCGSRSQARFAAEVGCIRNFELHDGSVIREQLLSLSDQDHACTYAILESHMGVENYTATFRLSPVTEDDTSFAEWWADFECAADEEKDLKEMIGTNVFAAGMRALGDWR